jgi:hypothetical protein
MGTEQVRKMSRKGRDNAFKQKSALTVTSWRRKFGKQKIKQKIPLASHIMVNF